MKLANEEQHEQFKKDLVNSYPSVRAVKRWLVFCGYEVVMPGNTIADKHADWADHSDPGDLYVRKKPEITEWARVEVKRIGPNFTCLSDWPFPNRFIVEDVRRYDSKDPEPMFFIVCSHDLTHAAVVKTETAPLWRKEFLRDNNKNYDKKWYYTIHPTKVEFFELPGEKEL